MVYIRHILLCMLLLHVCFTQCALSGGTLRSMSRGKVTALKKELGALGMPYFTEDPKTPPKLAQLVREQLRMSIYNHTQNLAQDIDWDVAVAKSVNFTPSFTSHHVRLHGIY